MYKSHSLFKLKTGAGFLLLIVVYIFSSQLAFAKTVTRGPQSTPVVLNWEVVGGSGTCKGDTDYQDSNDDIRTGWRTGIRSDTGDTSSISGWGSKIYANPRTYTFTCTDTTPPYAADTATLVVEDCGGSLSPGTVWNPTTKRCVSGALTIPATCPVASGQSTCTVSATWTTTDTTDPKLVDVNVGGGVITNSNVANKPSPGLTVYAWGGPGGTTFELRDGTTVLDTKNVIGACITGTAWNPSSDKCLPNNTSGTLTASPNPCIVPIGQSTCSTRLAWSTSNNQSPNIWNGATVLYTSAADNNQPATVTYPSTTFTLRKSNGVSGQIVDSITVTGVCTSGSTWNGSTCAANPTNPLTAPATCTVADGASTCTVAATWLDI